MEPLIIESYQLVNVSFLRLELAVFCRECMEKRGIKSPDDSCKECRIYKVRSFLNDPQGV